MSRLSSTVCHASLDSGGNYPLAGRSDRIVHRVGSQVRSIRPRDRAEFDAYLSEVVWIAQSFEQRPLYGGTLDERAQVDISGGSVNEHNVQTEVLIGAHG